MMSRCHGFFLAETMLGSASLLLAQGEAFRAEQVITTAADAAVSVYAADLDGDGDLDVLSASNFDDTIAWFANTDGLGSFGPRQVVTTAADGAIEVYAADVDGDGDMDALSASLFDGKIAWYENTDGLGSFGPQQVISAAADGAFGVMTADLDNDGDPDVLSASTNDDKIAWYENLRTAHLGAGCAGLLLRADAPMRVGVASTVTLENVPTVSPFGLFLLGSQVLPSPLALNSACTAYILPNLSTYLVLPALGRAQLTIPVPSDVALVGAQLAVQGTARSLDPSAWRSRFAVSNGVLYTIEN
ncbi:MAG: FG-GAP repeat domain-containing protein [Planctomycetota bacterium]